MVKSSPHDPQAAPSSGEDTATSARRVLVLAPVGRDAELICDTLRANAFQPQSCSGIQELCAEIKAGAGAALIAQEALGASPVDLLQSTLKQQPSWSELPLIIMTGRAAPRFKESQLSLSSLLALGNVTLLERPFQPLVLISVARSALQARVRQYEVRDSLHERERLLASEKMARQTAETYSRLKDEFLTTLSHELRTPLTAILGWADLLRAGKGLDARTAHGLDVILRNGEAQLQLISDLLDVSRITAGTLRLNVQRVDIVSIVCAAADVVRPAVHSKHIDLQLKLPPQIGMLSGDPVRLQQIIWNVLSNAVKFTPENGRITVALTRTSSQLEVSVSDTGEGIPPEFLPNIFGRFTQADPTSTRTHAGLGLGLAIVKQLVELHGGTVRAASRGAGLGSTITITLPAEPITVCPPEQIVPQLDAPREAHPEPENLDGVKVLVVDDDRDALDVAVTVLQGYGAIIITANTAEEAFASVTQQRPDVLLIDIGMPQENGYSLISRIRSLPAHEGGNTPAAAVTAYTRPEDQTQAFDAGFQLHVSKPYRPGELAAAVAAMTTRG